MNLICVPPDRISEFWPVAKPYIALACDRVGLLAEPYVEARVLEGKRQIWLVMDDCFVRGALVTHLFDEDGRRLCEITALGTDPGAAKHNLHLIERVEAFARDEGCVALRVIGREGWKRALPQYELKAVILEKAL